MRLILVVLLLVKVFASLAVTTEDSLKAEHQERVKNGIKSENDLEPIYNLLKLIRYQKPDTAIILANEGIEYAERINSTLYQAHFHEYLGDIYWHKGEMQSSLESYEISRQIHQDAGRDLLAAYLTSSMGYVYMDLSQNQKALEMYLEALSEARRLKEEDLRIIALTYVARLQDKLNQHEKAMDAYEEALEYFEEQEHWRNVVILNSNIAGILMEEDRFDQAEERYESALGLCRKIGDKKNEASLLMNLGTIQMKKENNSEALEYLDRSAQIFEELESNTHLSGVYNSMGQAMMRLGRMSEAINYIRKAEEIAQSTGDLDGLIRIYQNMTEYYELRNEPQMALESLRKHISLKDSSLSLESAKQINSLTEAYESEQRELELENLKKKEALQDVQLQKEKEESRRLALQRYMFAGGFALMLILAFVVLRGYRTKKKANKKLQDKNTEISKQKELVEEKNKEILDSINYAKRLQNAILPPMRLVKEYLHESFIYYKPKDIVAGDFYWMEITDEATYFAAADCTGHGVPGAMVSVVCSNALSKSLIEESITEPAKILDRTRDLVVQRFSRGNQGEADADIVRDGMDIALVKLYHNEGDLRLEYSGANNNLWIIRDLEYLPEPPLEFHPEEDTEKYQLIDIKADKQPIGQYASETPFTNHLVRIQSTDSIYIMSDGYVDQFGGPKNKKFKSANLKQLLISLQEEPMQKQMNVLDTTITEWMGDYEQVDDICVIGVRVD